MLVRFLAASALPSLVGASVESSLDPGSFGDVFLRYGVVGAIAFGGLWFAYKQNQRTEARADRYEAKNSSLEQEVREKLLPAVIASTQLNSEVAQLLRDLLRDRSPR